MISYAARGIAAVGAVLGVVAIWVEFEPGGATYWDSPHHVVGIVMLVLAILAGIGIVLAAATRLGLLDNIWLIAGLVLGGFYLFLPVTVASDGNGSVLKAGAWLGVASAGVFVAAAVVNALSALASRPTYVPAPAAPASTPPAPESTPTPAQASAPPADWYPDPTGQARLRYWDGSRWTDNTSP